MESFYSLVSPDTLLHQIFIPPSEANGATTTRTDISPAEQSLQVAFLSLQENQTFRPHKHIFHDRSMPMAQESWVVLSGSVEAILYDLDDSILARRVLEFGSLSITYQGGHNYISLSDSTLVYEFKTGPYLGQACDKVFIND